MRHVSIYNLLPNYNRMSKQDMTEPKTQNILFSATYTAMAILKIKAIAYELLKKQTIIILIPGSPWLQQMLKVIIILSLKLRVLNKHLLLSRRFIIVVITATATRENISSMWNLQSNTCQKWSKSYLKLDYQSELEPSPKLKREVNSTVKKSFHCVWKRSHFLR